jgi:uncharacterized protein (TIGR03086 family)
VSPRRAAAPQAGVALLERAINYTLDSLHLVTPAALSCPTPCGGWDLLTLLTHMNDSLTAMHEALHIGHVTLDTADEPAVALVAGLQSRACRLLAACTHADGHGEVSVAGLPLSTGIVTSAGAVEITMHGWDVARTCAGGRAIPEPLASELLALAPLLVNDADRPVRFAAPVDVSPLAGPADRLVAFLGRDPSAGL